MPKVIHFDLTAENPQRAMDFYQQVFNWRFEKWDGPMEYWLIDAGPEEEEGIGGGLAQRTSPDDGTLNTIGVTSLDETLPLIMDNGGEVVRDKTAVPGVGWLAYCRDTEGNDFGVMELDPEAA